MAAEMLNAYYSSGCNSESVFDHLNISKDPSFKQHLNQYITVFLNIQEMYFLKGLRNNNIGFVQYLCKEVFKELKQKFPKAELDENNLIESFQAVYNCTGKKFVFIIDEHDCPFRDNWQSENDKTEYLELIKNIFKAKSADNYIALAYLTGVLPIVKTNSQSALNNFNEFTIVSSSNFAPYFGFTNEEVQKICKEQNFSYEKVKLWYGGYIINGVEISNPYSISKLVAHRVYMSHWPEAASYEELIPYIEHKYDGVKEDLFKLINDNKIEKPNKNSFCNDLSLSE